MRLPHTASLPTRRTRVCALAAFTRTARHGSCAENSIGIAHATRGGLPHTDTPPVDFLISIKRTPHCNSRTISKSKIVTTTKGLKGDACSRYARARHARPRAAQRGDPTCVCVRPRPDRTKDHSRKHEPPSPHDTSIIAKSLLRRDPCTMHYSITHGAVRKKRTAVTGGERRRHDLENAPPAHPGGSSPPTATPGRGYLPVLSDRVEHAAGGVDADTKPAQRIQHDLAE